jgi:hypothetical protein
MISKNKAVFETDMRGNLLMHWSGSSESGSLHTPQLEITNCDLKFGLHIIWAGFQLL